LFHFFNFSTVFSRPGSQEFHIPFSEEIVTEHVKWAKPYDLGKTNVLFVPSIAAGRSVIELAQRFDLDYETVCIDEDWVVNHWSYNMNYFRTARHSLDAYKQPYSYLLKALQSKQYDVMVLPSIRGWNEMPSELRQLIMDRVKEGMGLVLIHPYEGHYPETQFLHEKLQPFSTMYKNMKQVPVPQNPVKGTLWSISPLINCPNNPLSAKGHVIIDKEALRAGTWQKVADHFIVNGVPLELYPYKFMKYYKYSVSPSAKVLIESDNGDPICAVRNYGKGRVVAFGFFNYGVIPLVDKKSYESGKSDIYWEYYFSLLGRSLLWAAGKEYEQQIDFDKIAQDVFSGEFKTGKNTPKDYGLPAGSDLEIVLRNETGQIEQEIKPGKKNKIVRPKNAGTYIVEMIANKNKKVFASECKTFRNDGKMKIEKIELDKNDYNDPDIIRGEVIFASNTGPEMGAVVLELLDNYDRIIQQKIKDSEFTQSVNFDFKVENFTTRCGWIRCSVMDDNKVIHDAQKKFFWIKSANLGNWDDFMFDMRWATYVPIVFPWQKARNLALYRMGVNLLDDPYTNFEISYRSPRNWGRDPEGELYLGWEEQDGPNANSLPWFEKFDGYNLTHDKSYLVREPCLSDPEYQEKQIKVLQKIAHEFKRYGTTWYDIGNESSLMSGIPPLDFCYSGFCLHNFREYLKKVYINLENLNNEWETSYTNWDDVFPQTVEEVQKTGNFAPWADHKRFMQVMWAERIKQFGDAIRSIDPEARVSLTNMRRSDPFLGVDHYLQEQSLEAVRPKEYYHRDFKSDILTFGGSGYAEIGEASKSSFLPGVMDGQVGTSAWWYYTCFDPDLTPSQSGQDLTEYYQLVKNGLGKLMLNVERVPQPIAMHYSFPSANAVWITDGNSLKRPYSKNFDRFFENRNMWDRILSELGFQYSWIAHEQLEKGGLNTNKYKIFILPNSIALSKKEADEIRIFVHLCKMAVYSSLTHNPV